MGFEEFVAAVIREIHDLGMTMSVEEQNSLFKNVNHRLLHSNLKTAKTRRQILWLESVNSLLHLTTNWSSLFLMLFLQSCNMFLKENIASMVKSYSKVNLRTLCESARANHQKDPVQKDDSLANRLSTSQTAASEGCIGFLKI